MSRDEEKSGRYRRPASAVDRADTPSVLIAEDNPDLQWRLARMLTVEGFRVIGTSSSAGALALLEQWPVNVAIINERIWSEPTVSGATFAARLLTLRPELPLIMVGSAAPAENLRSLQPAVELYPPIQPESVRWALEEALGDALFEPATEPSLKQAY